MAEEETAIHSRLMQSYGYCNLCANDVVEYVIFLLKGNLPSRISKNSIEWNWPLNPVEKSPKLGL